MRFLSIVVLFLFFSSQAWSAGDAPVGWERIAQQHLANEKRRVFFENCFEGTNLDAIKKYFLDPNVDVNRDNGYEDGDTALLLAVRQQDDEHIGLFEAVFHLQALKIILSHPDIDVNKANAKGETALQKAAFMGYIEAVELLLDHTAIDVNRADNDARTALMMAVLGGNNEVVHLLLGRDDIDVNALDNKGDGVFTRAVISGELAMVTLLLADPRFKREELLTNSDREVLIGAARAGDAVMVEYLMNNFNVEINLLNQFGQTALLASSGFSFFDVDNRGGVVRRLLKHPDIDTGVKYDGKTALMHAQDSGYKDVIDALIQAGVTE